MNMEIPLSQKTTVLIDRILSTIRPEYIKSAFTDQEPSWLSTYNAIKDDSWPKCYTYNDFDALPVHIKQECINIHNFSEKIFKDSIIKDADRLFQSLNSIKLNYDVLTALTDNLHIINDKKVIDFGCNYGYWSIFASLNNALSTIGADVRQDNISIANSIKHDLNIDDHRLSFVNHDIHDYSATTKLCSDKNTVLLLGLMYHVHGHYDILKSVCQPSVKHVLIESAEAKEIEDTTVPLIHWRNESTLELVSGSNGTDKTALVGYPNIAWFDLAMTQLNYKKVSEQKYFTYISSNKIDQFKRTRIILLYEQN